MDLFLRKGADHRLRGGHLWVYSNEVDSARSPLGDYAAGDLVAVRNANDRVLGSAYMEPNSLICARVYAPGELAQATRLTNAGTCTLSRQTFDSLIAAGKQAGIDLKL